MSHDTPQANEVLVRWNVPKAKRIGLIDADGVLYAAASRGQVMIGDEPAQLLTHEEIYRDALDRAHHQAAWLGDVDQVFLVLSARENFRKRILPSYKGQRKSSDRPIALDTLRGKFLEETRHEGLTVMLIDNLEADDVCGIAATTFQARGYETVIISPDKDLLQIPGMVLTPGIKGVLFSEVTVEAADRWHLFQTMAGDTVDNYKGIPGIGPAKANILLDTYLDPEERWTAMVTLAEAKGMTEEDLLVQARVARILRAEDWDATLKAPKLWRCPDINGARCLLPAELLTPNEE